MSIDKKPIPSVNAVKCRRNIFLRPRVSTADRNESRCTPRRQIMSPGSWIYHLSITAKPLILHAKKKADNSFLKNEQQPK
jgi:hypothetical protein